MAVLPAGVVTFLFTDIEGSSRLWEQHPDPMRTALEWHDSLLREAIEGRGGHIFKTVGDGVCAVFPGADAALAAAHAAQQELSAYTAGEFGPLKVRMALLTGQAELREGDYFGLCVNRAARLCAVGHGGQILLAQTTANLLAGAEAFTARGLSLRDMGLHRLKDLRDAEHVHQLICPGLPAEFLPLRSLDRFTHNLPYQLTTLIGRDADVARALRLLKGRREEGKRERVGEAGQEPSFPAPTRLLTLTGTGGCGKTRLALQVGAELLDECADGVWFVDLSALTDAALLPQTIAQALGESAEQTGRAAQDTLMDLLKSRALLLILDNCEHLVEGCAHLTAALLRACPGLRVLATSRENLNIGGETSLRVMPLPIPGERDTPEALLRCEAARLFIERAQAALPSWTLTPQNAAAVSQICRQMDGIPLALELAARRVKGMTVETIARQLSDSLPQWLGSRSDPPRQQTLQGAINWSYNLLTDAERVLLRRLSVFTGGWALDAAEAVCEDDEAMGEVGKRETVSHDRASAPSLPPLSLLPSSDVANVLLRLVDKSLVVFEEVEEGAGRYRLLETIRQYSLKSLEQSGEPDALRQRQLAWCLELAEQAEPQLQGPEQAAWLNRLEHEHDNLRAALKWTADAATRLRLASALWRFWYTRSYLTEGRGWLEGALKRSQNVAPAFRAKALNAAGILAWSQGDLEAAQHWHSLCLALREELNDQEGVAATYNNLALVARLRGDYATMRTRLEHSLTMYRKLHDNTRLATVLMNLGAAAVEQEDYSTGYTYLEESLLLFHQLEDNDNIANVLHIHAEAARKQGDATQACRLYLESLSIYHALEIKEGALRSLEGLGILALEQGQYEQASILFAASQQIRDTTGITATAEEAAAHSGREQALHNFMGGQAAADAWKAGRDMTLQEAVVYASRLRQG